MSITKEQILEAVAEMSVMDVVTLVSMIEEKFGVSASSVISVSSSTKNNSVVEEEKTEFDVILKAIGNNKISIIKTVRSVIGLGLKEAKDLVESAPTILKTNISKNEAENLKKILEDTGASVEIK